MSRHYGLHDRFLAWLMAREGGKYAAFVEGRKKDLVQDVRGTVVEIGPGTGPNLRFLQPDVRLVGIEPNPYMHPYFLEQARKDGRKAHLIQGLAESLPLPDASVDAILSTLVLCSVSVVDRVLQEVLRVLKPGGRFLFIEHVAAREGSRLHRIQRWVRPMWRWVGGGCEPDRATAEHLLRAGFRRVEYSRFAVPLPIVSPHIAGVAEK